MLLLKYLKSFEWHLRVKEKRYFLWFILHSVASGENEQRKTLNIRCDSIFIGIAAIRNKYTPFVSAKSICHYLLALLIQQSGMKTQDTSKSIWMPYYIRFEMNIYLGEGGQRFSDALNSIYTADRVTSNNSSHFRSHQSR